MAKAMLLRKRRSSTSTLGVVLYNIRQLLTLTSSQSGPRRGPALSNLGIIDDAAVLCIGGKIVSVGKTSQALRDPWLKANRKKLHELDCTGNVVLPAFVDSHTHPAFTAPRLVDFEKRVSGATYEEIAAAGGGIRASLEGVRKAMGSNLAAKVSEALHQMAAYGTGKVEAKSGYGLSLEAELKSLVAIKYAAKSWPGTVCSTLLGAHVVPPEFKGRSQDYVDLVCQNMIPQAAKRKLAEFVDVFCDRGAFSSEEAHQVLKAAVQYKLGVRAHVCQLSPCSLQLFLDYQPSSLDHLDHVLQGDIQRLSKTNTVATLVPGANYFLGLEQYPPARKLIEAGAAVGLATDYNPGTSPTLSMPFVLSLACTHMKMSPQEAIAAATINGAWAVNLNHRKGSIEPGKDADLAIFDVSDYREMPYWFGVNRCRAIILGGEVQLSQRSKNLA